MTRTTTRRLTIVAFPLALSAAACSDVGGRNDGEGGLGADGSGGAWVGGSGATTSTGGSAATGGEPATGGAATGGMATGGFATGGASTGGAASSGGAGSGGSSTGGASPTCPTNLVGWATQSGDSVASTTGGGNATPVRPTTVQQLLDYAADGAARVIEIDGTFNVPRLDVASNKTLVGIGNDAVINGGVRIRGYSDAPVSNVILRNITVNGATTDVDNDAVQLYFAHHVWIDHCAVFDGPDGNLDMTHAVNWVTVSWTKFNYTSNYERPAGESSDHRFSSLLGHSDSASAQAEDTGRLKVSFHHNWWGTGVIERMPRVRWGQVHVFNNYFDSDVSNYCVRAGKGARLLIEGNYFDHVNSPHEFNSAADKLTAHITAQNNTYDGTTGTQDTGGSGTALSSVPYSVSVESPAGIPTLVQACAGPR